MRLTQSRTRDRSTCRWGVTSAFRRRLAIARERAAPAPHEQIAAMILKLAATVRIPEMAAIETMTGIMIEELSDVSPEVLERTFRHWIRTQKFFPTIAELLEIAEPQMAMLRRLSACSHGQAEQPPADRAEQGLTTGAHRMRSQSSNMESPRDLNLLPAHGRLEALVPCGSSGTITVRPTTRGDRRR